MNIIGNMLKMPVFPIIDRFTLKQGQYYNFFVNTGNWSFDQLKEYQLTKLKELGKVWKLELNSWDDFYKLPLTTKKDIWDWKPPAGRKYHTHETSGSTGEPRIIYVPWETWYRKDALFHRSWKWLGRKPYQPALRLIAGTAEYAWYDWWRNDHVMNYREITPAHVEWVIKNKPYLIHGPGGATRILLEEVIRAGRADVLKDIRIEWCSQSSEGHKERLAPLVKGFHEQYGLAELPSVGTPCLYNTHVSMETGVIEVINGEIVVTDFNNYVMPVIRYRTGDEGKIKDGDCPCGRKHPILYDIKGRRTDYYFGPEVKKAVGWWVVSPISHKYGQIISAWKAIVYPKQHKFVLHVVFREGKENMAELESYKLWIKEELGLDCEIIKEPNAAGFKRELVKVVT